MILVTGGTGLVGSHLLYQLIDRGLPVRAIHRKGSRLDRVKEVFRIYTRDPDRLFNSIDWFEADINDIPSLSKAFSGITRVYHAAAYISFDPKHFHKLKKVNIEGTANVVNMCIDNGVHKLCFVSSIAALGDSEGDTLITEQDSWNPEDDNSVYAISKYGAEMEAWRGTQEGIDVVIVNPSVILGTGLRGSGSGSIIRMVARGAKYYTPGGIALVDVRDVVRAMLLLMDSEIRNERFILAGANMYQREFFEKAAGHFGSDPPSKGISRTALNILRTLDWASAKLLGTRRRLFKATVRSLFSISFYDGTKITSELDFEYTPLEETLEWASANFKKNGG